MGDEMVTLLAKGPIKKDGVHLMAGTTFECEAAQAQALIDVGAAVLASEEPPPGDQPPAVPPATEPTKPAENPEGQPPAVPPGDAPAPETGSPEVTTPESELVVE